MTAMEGMAGVIDVLEEKTSTRDVHQWTCKAPSPAVVQCQASLHHHRRRMASHLHNKNGNVALRAATINLSTTGAEAEVAGAISEARGAKTTAAEAVDLVARMT